MADARQVFVVNPASAGGRTAKAWPAIEGPATIRVLPHALRLCAPAPGRAREPATPA